MTNTTTINLTIALTKNQILERLLKAEHITFDELIVLMDVEPKVNYVPSPTPPYNPPYNPPYWYDIPPTYTIKTWEIAVDELKKATLP